MLLLCLSFVLIVTSSNLRVDPDTPLSARTRHSSRGERMVLVFSDEFEKDGRTFYPGEDKNWEAVDLHYWATGDLERYEPTQAVTDGGNLVLTIIRDGLKSGMVQSWNKFCLQGGLVEFRASMPRLNGVPSFWPGLWSLGNLARAGYGGSTHGMWPYSYDACDEGVEPKATDSGLAGQRINKCVAEPGFGLNPFQGRGAPEIDALEGMIVGGDTNMASQSYQVGPFNKGLQVDRSKVHVNNQAATLLNDWLGSDYQQAISYNTFWRGDEGVDGDFMTIGFEYKPGGVKEGGYIRWFRNGNETWTLNAEATAAQPGYVSERAMPTEPMYLLMNLALAPSWGGPNVQSLEFPAEFLVDYVRVYQDPDNIAVSCDPPSHPTAEYIKAHPQAYTNTSHMTWPYPIPSYSKCNNETCNGQGNCVPSTGVCECNIGYSGTKCEKKPTGDCSYLVTNSTCAPKYGTSMHSIRGLNEWLCQPENTFFTRCNDIVERYYSGCPDDFKAVFMMSNWYNTHEPFQGDFACVFDYSVGKIVNAENPRNC